MYLNAYIFLRYLNSTYKTEHKCVNYQENILIHSYYITTVKVIIFADLIFVYICNRVTMYPTAAAKYNRFSPTHLSKFI